MQRFVKLCLIYFLVCWMPTFGAITANMQWDVRTTGSDNNGGGYDSTIASPGTDFSQQDTAQVAYTDMTLGVGGTTYTSAAHTPGTNLIANTLQIISGSGCTAGFYLVTAESGGTATLDRSAGTAASVCTANLGGGLQTITQGQTASTTGNTIWIKGGTYTLTTGLTVPHANMTYWGYGSFHGDAGGPPLLTTSTNSINIFTGVSTNPAETTINNISMSSTAGTRGFGIFASSAWNGLTVLNCKLSGFSVGINGDNAGATFWMAGVMVANTEITGSSTAALKTSGFFYGNYIHANSGDGWTLGSAVQAGGSSTFANNIFSGNNHGINASAIGSDGTLLLTNNVFYNQTSDGVLVAGTFAPPFIGLINNVFYSNGGYGVNVSSGSSINTPGLNRNNGYGANTNGARNLISAGVSDVTLTANPFTNAGSADFSLNNTAGGGAALRGAGFPGLIGGSSSTGALDIGAIQHSGSGSGGQKGFPIVQ